MKAANTMQHFHSIAYRCLWLAILVLLAVYGIKALCAPQINPVAENGNPYCGTDGILLQSLAVPRASQKILDTLSSMPQKGKVVVFWSGEEGSSIVTGYLVSYLTWPRDTWSVPMDEARVAKATADFQKASFDTAVFYALKPPAGLPVAGRIGPMFISSLEPRK